MTDQPPSHLDQLTPGTALLGALMAKVRVASRQDCDAVVEAEIFDPEGNLVARATAKLRIVRRK